MSDYTCKLVTANRELSAVEKIRIKDMGNAIKMDDVLGDGPLVVKPDVWAELEVHNEKSTNKDYRKFVIIDESGTKFVTGSVSFWRAFEDICDELTDAGVDFKSEELSVEIFKKESKNYAGKSFITCSLI